MSRAGESTLTFFVIYLSPPKPKSCLGRYSHIFCDNLTIFGRDIYQVKWKCRMQIEKKNSHYDLFLVHDIDILIIFARCIDKDQKRCCSQKKTTFTFFVVNLSPLKSCAAYNSHTV